MIPMLLPVLATAAGLFNLAAGGPVGLRGGTGGQVMNSTSQLMQQAALSGIIAESATHHTKKRRDAVHRCHDTVPEFVSKPPGPAPPVDDCNDVIQKLKAVQGDITVKLVEGCYEVWSGNCTGSVCPQRIGTSTISPALAAQYMADSIIPECISKGLRGWYVDRDYGIGVYLT
ncbi:hypothetical protein AAE478_004851 [Parahypoxylon ruwenzoriense]